MREITAIVLTFDRNRLSTLNMLASYEDLWPTHPFRFLVPFQKTKEGSSSFNVEPVPSPPGIMDTVAALIERVGPEELVWWAIDDKFLAQVNVDRIELALEKSFSEPHLDGLAFTELDKKRIGLRPNSRYFSGPAIVGGEKGLRKKTFHRIWLHQLVRAQVVRDFFSPIHSVSSAKELDKYVQRKLPDDKFLYVTRTTLLSFWESTHRGVPTRELINSLSARELQLTSSEQLIAPARSESLAAYPVVSRIGKVNDYGKLSNMFRLGRGRVALEPP